MDRQTGSFSDEGICIRGKTDRQIVRRMHRPTDRPMDRQKDSQTNRLTDRYFCQTKQ